MTLKKLLPLLFLSLCSPTAPAYAQFVGHDITKQEYIPDFILVEEGEDHLVIRYFNNLYGPDNVEDYEYYSVDTKVGTFTFMVHSRDNHRPESVFLLDQPDDWVMLEPDPDTFESPVPDNATMFYTFVRWGGA